MRKDEKRGFETASPEIYDLLKIHARNKRQEMTESEKVLWNALRCNIKGYRFRRQHALENYIADFVCLSVKLIIEVDGEYHNSSQQRDKDILRTAHLKLKGFHVIRFSNKEVSDNIKGVIQTIKEELFKQEEKE